jgi:hypothetical protein
MEMPMNEQWQYQLRVYLTDDLADVARNDRNNPALRPLTDILDKHHATLVNQFDASRGRAYARTGREIASADYFGWPEARETDAERAVFAAEKLASCQRLRLGVETLRQWMIADGLWIDRRHRLASPHQPRRRRECLGELVQIDGSAEAKRVSAHQLETPINRPGRDGCRARPMRLRRLCRTCSAAEPVPCLAGSGWSR